MKRRLSKCKDNNAAIVKRMMPDGTSAVELHGAKVYSTIGQCIPALADRKGLTLD